MLVRRALAVGLTLNELALFLSERDKGGAPCREVRRLVAEKLSNIEEQLVALITLRDELRLTLTDWDKRLAAANSSVQVRLLESLMTSPTQENKLLHTTENGKRKLSSNLNNKKKRNVK